MTDAAVDFTDRLARTRRRTTEHVRLAPARPRRDQAFTAAAERLDPARDEQLKSALGYRQPWQAEAWDAYDENGEVGRSAEFMSDAMTRVRWFPGVRMEPDGEVLPLDATDENDRPVVSPQDQATVRDAFARLGGGSNASISGLFGEASLHLFVPGEGYLLGYETDDEIDDTGAVLTPEGEVWRIVASERLSVNERGRVSLSPWTPRQRGVQTYTQTTGKPVELPENVFVARFWNPHPRDRRLARSAVKRVLTEVEELRIKLLAIRAQELQRMNGGILVIPGSASNRAINEAQGGPPVSPLARQIMEHIVTPIRDPGSAAAAAPFVLELDRDHADKAKWITAPAVDRRDQEERDELSRRIVMSLPVPSEQIMGLGETSTFANARVITEQTWTMFCAPHADALAESFAIGYLRREIAERGVQDVGRFAIGADPAELIGKPNRSEEISEAHERLVVSDSYYRESRGIPDEAAPDDEEVARRLAIEQAKRGGGTGQSVSPSDDTDAPASDGESTDPNADDEAIAAAATPLARGERASRRVARIEADLRAKVHAYMASLVERAVEKTGAKARTKARNQETFAAAIGAVPNRAVCAQLGPAMVAALSLDEESVLAEVIEGGAAQFEQWTRQAQDEALRVAARLGDVDDATLDALRARQNDDRAAGWLLLSAALLTVARARLFDPDPQAPEVGEFDGSPLPMAPVAAALARAGGAAGPVVSVPFAGVRLPAAITTAEGEPEPGGATAGPSGRDAFRAAGFARVGYEWQTGTPERPFEPHQNLDGLSFRSFFDDALVNPNDWPPHPYYFAGDHAGCLCQQVTIFEEAP